MDSIHFHKGIKPQTAKTVIGAAGKDRPVDDLGLMDLSGPVLHFALQVDVPWRKQPAINVGIHCPYRDAKFRMVGADLVR